MLEIHITLNEEETGQVVKNGICIVKEGENGQAFTFTATLRQERSALLKAVNDALDRLEGIVEESAPEKPISIPKPKAKTASKP